MNKVKILSSITVATAVLSMAGGIKVHAEDSNIGNATSNESVGFVPDDAKPKDTVTGTEDVTNKVGDYEMPAEIVSGNDANKYLSLDVVPTLNFGNHKLNSKMQSTGSSYGAYPISQTYGGKTYAGRPNYIQVTDNRNNGGSISDSTGWKVSAKMVDQFKNGGMQLDGASIVFGSSGKSNVVSSSSYKSNDSNNTLEKTLTPNIETTMFTSGVGEPSNPKGIGTNLLNFGTSNPTNDGKTEDFPLMTDESSGYQSGDDSLNSENSSKTINKDIQLKVPAGQAQNGTYTAKIQWSLSNTPV